MEPQSLEVNTLHNLFQHAVHNLLFLFALLALEIISVKSEPSVVGECAPVTFWCEVKPISSEIYWSANGMNISKNLTKEEVSEESGVRTSSFRLSCVKRTQSGLYRCHAFLPGSPKDVIDKNVSLEVQCEPLHTSL